MSITFSAIRAMEILDSRSRPTLAVLATTPQGRFESGVPSGASTGSGEAVELRDGDKARYGGNGVLTAAGHVNGEIAERFVGREFADLAEVDQALIDLDGTDNSRDWGRTRSSGSRWLPRVPLPTTKTSRCGASSPHRV